MNYLLRGVTVIVGFVRGANVEYARVKNLTLVRHVIVNGFKRT